MRTIYDIQQYLKQYGTYIYTTDRVVDLGLMEGELKELYEAQILPREEYFMALLLIKQELQKVKNDSLQLDV